MNAIHLPTEVPLTAASPEAVSPSRVCWYPMRATYNRELLVKQALDRQGIENFVPMHYEHKEYAGERRRMLVPAIHNLVFVHSSKARLNELKRFSPDFAPMRYMVRYTKAGGSTPQIITVPDTQMQNFMRVASTVSDDVVYLRYDDFLNKEGRHVRVIDGNFAGVEGVIKRIKRDRIVVVLLQNIAAVAITHLPPQHLQLL